MRKHGLQGEARVEVREGSVKAERTQVPLRAEESRKIRYPQSQDGGFGEEGQGGQGRSLPDWIILDYSINEAEECLLYY
jgi:hypothetical protein